MNIQVIIKKTGTYILVTAILLGAGLFVYGRDQAYLKGDYTTYNSNSAGTKALYLLAGQMGFEVDRFERQSKYLPDEAVMVIVNPGRERFMQKLERKYLKEWIERGNTLIVIINTSELEQYKLYEFLPVNQGFVSDYIYDIELLKGQTRKGKLIVIDNCQAFTNNGLKSITPGIVFIHALEKAGSKKVLFNEYYHGIGSEGSGVWELLGQTGRLVTIQLFLGLALLLYVKARRFGKPVTVFEITKRMENENLYALANLYTKARANTLVLETYLLGFKKELARFLGFATVPEDSELAYHADKNSYLKGNNIDRVLRECREYIEGSKSNTNKLMRLVEELEHIRKGIKQ